jgi:chemotaxis protein histidine kinase CheA
VPSISGATIMGDGRVAMIIDAGELVSSVQKV